MSRQGETPCPSEAIGVGDLAAYSAADRLKILEEFAVAAGEALRSLVVQVGTLTAYNEALIREINDLTAEALMKRAS